MGFVEMREETKRDRLGQLLAAIASRVAHAMASIPPASARRPFDSRRESTTGNP